MNQPLAPTCEIMLILMAQWLRSTGEPGPRIPLERPGFSTFVLTGTFRTLCDLPTPPLQPLPTTCTECH
jgi:hypothetical protein